MGTPGGGRPRTAREWQVYRRGILEGVRLAQARAHVDAVTFQRRVECGGVLFDVPSAAAAVQTSAGKRKRAS